MIGEMAAWKRFPSEVMDYRKQDSKSQDASNERIDLSINYQRPVGTPCRLKVIFGSPEVTEPQIYQTDLKGDKKMRKIGLIFCLTILVATFAMQSSFAAATDCSYVVTKGNGSSTLKIAVASNFYGPAKDMVTGFLGQSSSIVNNITVTICHNSTQVLLSEILANHTRYDIFFAADTTAYTTTQAPFNNYAAFIYAKGMPVIFGYTAVPNPNPNAVNSNNLITDVIDLVSGANVIGYADSISPVTTSYSITAQPVAVANPSTAPYGTVASYIIAAMGTPSPAYVQFDNISLTYNAVGTNVTVNNATHHIKSGFVSKTQICHDLNNVAYIEFPDYQLEQTARQITANATGLRSYITGKMATTGTGGWNAFLDGHCYGH